MRLSFDHNIFKGEDTAVVEGAAEVTWTLQRFYTYAGEFENALDEEAVLDALAEDAGEDLPDSVLRGRLARAIEEGEIERHVNRAVDIELRPGASFEYSFTRKTEEGYFSRWTQATWDEEKRGWHVVEQDSGSDCSGPYEKTPRKRFEKL